MKSYILVECKQWCYNSHCDSHSRRYYRVVCLPDKTDAKSRQHSGDQNVFYTLGENNITLCVENIGTGFARDIKFTGDLSF